MKNYVLAALALSTIACASTQPQTETTAGAPSDQRAAEMQTALTELLERLDVMNDRLARLEESRAIAPAPQPVAAPVPSPVPASRPVPVPQPAASQPRAPQPTDRALASAAIADAYRGAIVLYGKGRTADARQAFQSVFDSDPTGELADNALYWIGETYFAAKDWNNAMRFYRRVSIDFGDQNKAPDALYKMGLALARTGDLALARQTLEEVISKYPYSSPAASARQELARIKY